MARKRHPGLDKKIFALDFKGGLNQLVADHSLDAGHLLQAENAVFDNQGALSKRAGHDDLSNTVVGGGSQTSLSEGVQILKYKNGVIGIDDKKAFRRVHDGSWLAGEEIVDCRFDQQGTANARNMSQSNAQIVTLNNRVFTAWAEHHVRDDGATLTYKIYLTVRDGTTDAILLNRHEVRSVDVDFLATAPSYQIPRVQLTYGGNYVAIAWVESAEIKAATVDSTASVITGTSAVFQLGTTDLHADYWVFTVAHINHSGASDRICWVQTTTGSTVVRVEHGILGDGSYTKKSSALLSLTLAWHSGVGKDHVWNGLALQTVDSDNLIVIGYNVGTNVKVTTLLTGDTSLTATGGLADATVMAGHLINLSVVADPVAADRLRCAATIITRTADKGGGDSYVHSQPHALVMFGIDHSGTPALLGGGTDSVVEVAQYVSLHTDLFVENNQIYGVVAQAYRPSGAGAYGTTDYKWGNSRNILTQFDFTYDEDDDEPAYRLLPMAAGNWGKGAINYAVDYNLCAYNAPTTTALSGTATSASANYGVTGSDTGSGPTAFDTEVSPGDVIHITHSGPPVRVEKRTVDSVVTASQLIVTEAFVYSTIDASPVIDATPDTDSSNPAKRQMYSVQRVQSLGGGQYRYGSSQWAGEWITGSSPHNTAETNLNFAPDRYFPSLEARDSLYLGGGFLWEYSGDRFKEHGFFTGTEIIGVFTRKNGNLSAGVYHFIVVLEWTAPNGDVHRSAPSEISEGTTALAGDSYTLLIHTPQLSYKNPSFGLPNTKVVVYRTTAGQGLFSRDVVTDLDTSAWQMNISYAGSTDDELMTYERIYTSGNRYANITPPSVVDLALHGDRIMAATTDRDVWFTKPHLLGIGPEFSDINTIAPLDRADEITAIASNMESLVIFTENNGYYVAGSGPNENGTAGAFSEPRLFSSGMGVTSGSPHLAFPDGILVISNGSLYVVGRNLSLTYIGGAVKNLEPLDVKAMLLRDDRKEIEIVLKGAIGKLEILKFNTLYQQLTTVYDAQIQDYAAGAVLVGNAPHYFSTMGIELVENTDFIDDTDQDTLPVTMSIKTAWIKLGLLQQLQRAYRLLLYIDVVTPHTLNVAISYDYDETVVETKTIALTSVGPEFLRFRLDQQKCRAIMVRIYDSDTSGVSREAFKLNGVALELGLRGGTFKVNSDRELTT